MNDMYINKQTKSVFCFRFCFEEEEKYGTNTHTAFVGDFYTLLITEFNLKRIIQ